MNTHHVFANGKLVESSSSPARPGRGDRIAKFVQPIAGAVDMIAGTNIAGCVDCGKMKKRLNKGMSIKEALKLRFAERSAIRDQRSEKSV